MKRALGPTEMLFPMPTALVAAEGDSGRDVTTVAWIAVAGSTPSSVVMALRGTRRVLEVIRESGEFTVNLPKASDAARADHCGLVSGRHTDKFEATGYTATPGLHVRAPLIEECPLNLECRLTQEVAMGEYVLVVGEILETHLDEDVLAPEGDRPDVTRLDPLVYCPKVREYRGLGPKVADAFKVGKGLGG